MYHDYYQDLNYLQHYGRKGMKWYQTIFTKEGRAASRKRRQEKFDRTKKPKIMAKGDIEKAYKKKKYFTDEELNSLATAAKNKANVQSTALSGGKAGSRETQRRIITNVDLRTAYKNAGKFTTDELIELQKRHEALMYMKKNRTKRFAKNY